MKKILGAKKMPSACLVGVLALAAFRVDAAGFVLAYTDAQSTDSYVNLQKFYGNLSAVGLGSAYSLKADGSLLSEGANATNASIVTFAKSKNLPVYPTVSDYSNAFEGFDPAISNQILSTAANRTRAINNLVAFAVNQGFAGLNIDLEAVQPANRANYSAFLSSLASALRVYGMKMIVSVPAKLGDQSPEYLNGYDYAAIGNAADYLQVMTYDQVGPGWSSSGFNNVQWPGPESGLNWQKAVLTYAASVVQAGKVLSGLPSYGYDFSSNTLVHWSNFAGVIAAHPGAVLGRDAASATPFASWGTVVPKADGVAWTTASAQPVLWYDDAQSVQAKAALVPALGLGGTSVWAMGYENAAFWSALATGIQGTPMKAALTITASAGAGGSISPAGTVQVTQGASQSFAIKPNAGYVIKSVSVDGVEVGALGSYTFADVQSNHALAASFSATATGQGNLEQAGKGYLWARNTSATSNANRGDGSGLNDGNVQVGVNLNPSGEKGAARWEAAGIVWTAAKAVSSVRFVNGAMDKNGNGLFESQVTLQFTTDGKTWRESGWTLAPSYPYGARVTEARTYTFSGTECAGILGVRISGRTGANSWSAIVNEVQVIGR